MPQKLKSSSRRPALALGLGAAAKINAVEGVMLSEESRRLFARFEKENTAPAERRRVLLEKHAKKA